MTNLYFICNSLLSGSDIVRIVSGLQSLKIVNIPKNNGHVEYLTFVNVHAESVQKKNYISIMNFTS